MKADAQEIKKSDRALTYMKVNEPQLYQKLQGQLEAQSNSNSKGQQSELADPGVMTATENHNISSIPKDKKDLKP